jgi:hypothetical protein
VFELANQMFNIEIRDFATSCRLASGPDRHTSPISSATVLPSAAVLSPTRPSQTSTFTSATLAFPIHYAMCTRWSDKHPRLGHDEVRFTATGRTSASVCAYRSHVTVK